MSKKLLLLLGVFLAFFIFIIALIIGAYFIINRFRVYEPLNEIRTIKATDGKESVRFKDPFGIAVSADGIIYVSDGDTGKIHAIDVEGKAKILTESFDTPSAIAIDTDGSLIVADTGEHTIKRVDVEKGTVTVVAGVKDKSGFADGNAKEALFNAPIGVAVGKDGMIFVADTYNDRIRSIDKNGQVKTIAGGDSPDYIDDGDGTKARFDTPCGIAVLPDGALLIADTGNNVIRRIEKNGATQTFAKDWSTGANDPNQYGFYEPTAILVENEKTFYVADSGSAAIRVCKTEPSVVCTTFAGSESRGLKDGELTKSKFSRPVNLAIAGDGTIVITDSGNGLIRTAVGKQRERGENLPADEIASLRTKPEDFRKTAPPRWPYNPPERAREIAATFGEIRGEMQHADGEARFHNGLDIPGPMGETVRSVRTEKSLLPLPVGLFKTKREYLRLPTMGYVHINVGRDLEDKNFDKERFQYRYDKEGKLAGARVRRGTKFNAGDGLGTLNNMYHVHLIAGRSGEEMNALAALELPGIKDNVAPVIEKDGVKIFDKNWNEMKDGVSGEVRIVVETFDQMDGNASRRKLGVYRLGYQILNADGTLLEDKQTTISFERLPEEEWAARFIYAKGSRADATGETTFAYIVTNSVKDGEVKEGFWNSANLNEGDFIVRVFVEDFFGNRTTKDVKVKLKK